MNYIEYPSRDHSWPDYGAGPVGSAMLAAQHFVFLMSHDLEGEIAAGKLPAMNSGTATRPIAPGILIPDAARQAAWRADGEDDAVAWDDLIAASDGDPSPPYPTHTYRRAYYIQASWRFAAAIRIGYGLTVGGYATLDRDADPDDLSSADILSRRLDDLSDHIAWLDEPLDKERREEKRQRVLSVTRWTRQLSLAARLDALTRQYSSAREAARVARVNDRTFRRMLNTGTGLGDDDPIFDRLEAGL